MHTKNYPTRKLKLILILISCSISITAQDLVWREIGNKFSFYDYADKDSNDNIYCVGSGFTNSSMIAVDKDGTVLFKDTLYSENDPVVLLDDLDSNNIKIITRKAKVYSYNKETTEIQLLDSIMGLGIQMIRHAEKSNGDYVLIGTEEGNTGYYVRLRIDVSSFFIIKRDEYPAYGSLEQILDSPQSETVKELYSSRGEQTIVCRNYTDSILWEKEYLGDSIVARKIMEYSDGSIFMIGTARKDIGTSRSSGGLLMKLNSTGEEQWRRSYFRPDNLERNDLRLFHDITESGYGKVLVTGTEGYVPGGPVTDLYMMETDTSGVVIWDKIQNLYGSSTANRVLLMDEHCFYTAGTCNQSDTGEPERLFIAKHQFIPTQQREITNESEMMFYPNPVSANMILSRDHEGEQYEIYNFNGQMVKKGLAKQSIDVSTLHSGIYYLSIAGEKGQMKFVKR